MERARPRSSPDPPTRDDGDTSADAAAESTLRAARSEVPVLILGEPGSGRSQLAREIHAASRRRGRPLVEVEASLLTPELADAELFGVRRGAFTGADADRPGRVGRAAGGSLLFDHVEELHPRVQPKLLRLLAEQRFTPLGGAEATADVRILAIGTPDLAERLRADLYHRLAVLVLEVAPLRRRRAEIPALAARWLEQRARKMGRPVPQLAPTACAWMTGHPWPGNLRQMANVLERALLDADGEEELNPPPPPPEGQPPPSLEEVEREAIRAALAWTRGHQAAAAALLGISRKTLWDKRRRHGLP